MTKISKSTRVTTMTGFVSSNQNVWACPKDHNAHIWDYRHHLLDRMNVVLRANGLKTLQER